VSSSRASRTSDKKQKLKQTNPKVAGFRLKNQKLKQTNPKVTMALGFAFKKSKLKETNLKSATWGIRSVSFGICFLSFWDLLV
jgi:hypothetical protein